MIDEKILNLYYETRKRREEFEFTDAFERYGDETKIEDVYSLGFNNGIIRGEDKAENAILLEFENKLKEIILVSMCEYD